MIGIGLVILWLGYAAFATGHAAAKGIPNVGFSQMVLPKNRTTTLGLLKAGQAGLNTSILGAGTTGPLGTGAIQPAPTSTGTGG